jgi:predicted nucleic acid-binding protein
MIVVDTGPIVAMANEQDRHHARCVDWFDRAPRPLLMPAPILTEVCYLLERERGSAVEADFLRSVRDEVFTLVALSSADLDRMAELVETFRVCRSGPLMPL